MVLILDVARFKYPAYWVSLDLLWQSLHPLDTSTGKPRGYVVLQKGSRSYVASALSQLAVTSDSWPRLSNILFHELPSRFVTSPPTSPADFIKTVVESIPDSYDSVVENRLPLFVSPSSVSDPSDEVPAAAASSEEGLKGPENGPVSAVAFDTYVSGLDDLLHKLANTDLYRLVEASIAARNRTRQREALMAMAAAASAKAAARMRRENEEKISSGPPGLSRVRSSERLIDDAEKISSPPMSPRYHLNYAGSLLSRRSSANLSGGMSPERRRLSLSLCQTHFHPANHPVNDFTAFLTIFLFALFSYKPWHEELLDVQEEPNERKSQTDLSKDLPTKPAPVRSEPTVKCRRRLSMAEQVRGLVNLDVAGIQDSVIREEVAFLRNQIAALTELQLQDSRRNGTDVAPTST
ncbi:hypothetical protein PhCBS80983_g01490 [Powellomyces hirtus]|uniref:glutathione gamma-glutamylcysteinyltransferase n=1 Tax=Powellomyces hirtus TaxID=109895 RepID=A0A507EAL1_9FUNG|nr:hypothetical protein PhCBS80983_g01490 [Powellomyces hirtus]